MTRLQLASLLSSIIAASVAAPACTRCPYTEVLSTSTVEVDAAKACELANDAFGRREVAPSINPAACAAACNDPAVNACELDQAYLDAYFAPDPTDADAGAGGGGGAGPTGNALCPSGPTKATLTCRVTESLGEYHDGCPIAGRRPAALAPAEVSGVCGDSAGAFLARAAQLEAASVIAFQYIAAELDALGAPAALLADVREAEADEVRHTAAMTRLARAHGAEVTAPVVGPRAARSVEAMALENAVEGLVRETFGAAVALHQAGHAQDPGVRAALAVIAQEECAHAALSQRIGEFLEARLDAGARARIQDAMRAAIVTLSAEIEAPAPSCARTLGLPTGDVARRILAGIGDALWVTALAA